VCEAPGPVPSARPPPNDPAIIAMPGRGGSGPNQPQMYSSYLPEGYALPHGYPQQFANPNQFNPYYMQGGPYFGTFQQPAPPNQQGPTRSNVQHIPTNPESHSSQPAESQGHVKVPVKEEKPKAATTTVPAKQQTVPETAPPSNTSKAEEEEETTPSHDNTSRRQYSNHRDSNYSNRGQQNKFPRRTTNNYQQKSNIPPNRTRKVSTDNTKLMDDFNFDEANARFSKEKLLEEVAADKPTDMNDTSEHGYNKDSSFFDNISCEATDRKDGKEKARASLSEQRKIDAETFGQTNSYRRGGMSRGRGRRYNSQYNNGPNNTRDNQRYNNQDPQRHNNQDPQRHNNQDAQRHNNQDQPRHNNQDQPRYNNQDQQRYNNQDQQKVFRPVNQNSDRGRRNNTPKRGGDKTQTAN